MSASTLTAPAETDELLDTLGIEALEIPETPIQTIDDKRMAIVEYCSSLLGNRNTLIQLPALPTFNTKEQLLVLLAKSDDETIEQIHRATHRSEYPHTPTAWELD